MTKCQVPAEFELADPKPAALIESLRAFGYTTRVVPQHRLMTGPAELGLAALPPAGTGMDSGDLR